MESNDGGPSMWDQQLEPRGRPQWTRRLASSVGKIIATTIGGLLLVAWTFDFIEWSLPFLAHTLPGIVLGAYHLAISTVAPIFSVRSLALMAVIALFILISAVNAVNARIGNLTKEVSALRSEIQARHSR